MKMMNRFLDVALMLGLAPFLWIGVCALFDAILVSHSAVIDKGILELANAQSDKLFDEMNSKYVIAWLKIDNTNINYPVVQGEDNSWFLNRNYKGDFATAGSIFLDYRNVKDFGDNFSIIYGHRMGNGEMFSDIQKYKNEEFFSLNQSGSLRLKKREISLKIIAYAEVKADDWGIYNVEKSANDNSSDAIRRVLEAAI